MACGTRPSDNDDDYTAATAAAASALVTADRQYGLGEGYGLEVRFTDAM